MSALRWAVVAALLMLGSDARADATIVSIENFTFNPPELTIKAGTTVTWKNADDIPHSVVEDNTTQRSCPDEACAVQGPATIMRVHDSQIPVGQELPSGRERVAIFGCAVVLPHRFTPFVRCVPHDF